MGNHSCSWQQHSDRLSLAEYSKVNWTAENRHCKYLVVFNGHQFFWFSTHVGFLLFTQWLLDLFMPFVSYLNLANRIEKNTSLDRLHVISTTRFRICHWFTPVCSFVVPWQIFRFLLVLRCRRGTDVINVTASHEFISSNPSWRDKQRERERKEKNHHESVRLTSGYIYMYIYTRNPVSRINWSRLSSILLWNSLFWLS